MLSPCDMTWRICLTGSGKKWSMGWDMCRKSPGKREAGPGDRQGGGIGFGIWILVHTVCTVALEGIVDQTLVTYTVLMHEVVAALASQELDGAPKAPDLGDAAVTIS